MPEQNLNPDALDVLATVVFSCPLEDWNEHDEDEKRQLLAPYTRIIDTYLSALPAQPELPENSKPNQNLEFDTVNSVEELEALPCASVVLNGVTAFQKYGAREPFDWSADGRWYDSTQVELPARVLYRPTEEATDGRE